VAGEDHEGGRSGGCAAEEVAAGERAKPITSRRFANAAFPLTPTLSLGEREKSVR